MKLVLRTNRTSVINFNVELLKNGLRRRVLGLVEEVTL